MVAKASIIKNYAKADAAGKVDIICKNYSNFIGKDSKGYVLRTGGTQRMDGRYCYAYTGKNKKRHYVYVQGLPGLRAKKKELLIKYE